MSRLRRSFERRAKQSGQRKREKRPAAQPTGGHCVLAPSNARSRVGPFVENVMRNGQPIFAAMKIFRTKLGFALICIAPVNCEIYDSLRAKTLAEGRKANLQHCAVSQTGYFVSAQIRRDMGFSKTSLLQADFKGKLG
jgi:hypothetical protein